MHDERADQKYYAWEDSSSKEVLNKKHALDRKGSKPQTSNLSKQKNAKLENDRQTLQQEREIAPSVHPPLIIFGADLSNHSPSAQFLVSGMRFGGVFLHGDSRRVKGIIGGSCCESQVLAFPVSLSACRILILVNNSR
jgi:hypothetical protein